MPYINKTTVYDFDQDIGSKESMGQKTKRLLKEKGVKSPKVQNLIKVKKGMWVIPKKKPKDDIEREKLELKYKAKYGDDS